MYYHKRWEHVFLSPEWTKKNFFEIDHITYAASRLDHNDRSKGIGVNASVFRARVAEEGGSEYVVKVCNFEQESNAARAIRRRQRFEREIDAMRSALAEGKGDLVTRIVGDGQVILNDAQTHRCFIMEAADCDLAEYLSGDEVFEMPQRLLLCVELLRSVRALHEIGIYHRDIKPGNVLSVGGRWKIADLGLIARRDEDMEWEKREKIGPPPWMSPEAFNRALCLLRADNTFIEREIDERSDVYQLGKLCWYILQGDIPNGCLMSRDLVHGGEQVYGLLKSMLRYRQSERPLLAEVENRMEPLMRRFAIA